MRPVIYIAGPFRGNPNIEWNRQQNIRRAEEAALQVWLNGGAAMCPHKNTEHFDGVLPDEVFIDGDLALLQKADAVYAIPGWSLSIGACGELAFALEHKIPVFYSLDQVIEYVTTRQA